MFMDFVKTPEGVILTQVEDYSHITEMIHQMDAVIATIPLDSNGKEVDPTAMTDDQRETTSKAFMAFLDSISDPRFVIPPMETKERRAEGYLIDQWIVGNTLLVSEQLSPMYGSRNGTIRGVKPKVENDKSLDMIRADPPTLTSAVLAVFGLRILIGFHDVGKRVTDEVFVEFPKQMEPYQEIILLP